MNTGEGDKQGNLMGKSLACEIQEVRSCLLASKPKPDEVDRSTGTDQEAYEREVGRA